jgi:SAM-dependent methyltransferase
MPIDQAVMAHYTHGDLAAAILAGLEQSGKDPDDLVLADLAPVDELHVGGRPATVDFAARLDAGIGMHLLDIGCGIGGPARHFAGVRGCRVTGIDLTEEFCQVATLLTALTRLSDRIDYRRASALALPFDAAAFDGAYTIHAAMNIADKTAFYAEARRVVKPGGLFGLYDVLQGPGGRARYPAPWAEDPSTSFLVTIEELRALLDAAGFQILTQRDRTAFGVAFFHETRGRFAEGPPPPLGPQIIMGETYRTKIANTLRNIEDARIAPWEVICRAV